MLIAGQGRHASLDQAAAPPADASGLYLSGGAPQLNLALRQAEQERVLAQVQSRVETLRQAIDHLDAPDGDLPQDAVTALSPRPESLGVTADGLATAPASHTVEVQWPAQPGTILSPPQNPVALVDLSDGAHTFTLTIDGVEHQLSVGVNNNDQAVDSQEDLLGRLARAIAGVDPGLTASVESSLDDAHDPTPGHRLLNRAVRLRVEGVGPGQGVSFSLVDDAGTLVGAYGLESQVPPQAASLRLGGALTSQDSNDFSLDNGHLVATALAGGDGPLEIAVRAGARPITDQLQAVISQYNGLLGYLDLHADMLRPSLKDRVARPLEDRAALMPALGLKATAQGRLVMGESFAQRLLSDFAAARRTLLDEDGWTTALGAKLDQILALGVEAFGQPLQSESLLEQSRRVWRTLEQTRLGIVNGYY